MQISLSATKIQQSMNCCCVQLDNPPSTHTTKHLVTTLYLQQCSNANSGVSATRCPDAENTTKIQQSMNCCYVQLNSPSSTNEVKHLVATPYLQNCSNAHLGVLATKCPDAENSEPNQDTSQQQNKQYASM
eukprot:3824245-Ditylum_brightwellii.AAC.1